MNISPRCGKSKMPFGFGVARCGLSSLGTSATRSAVDNSMMSPCRIYRGGAIYRRRLGIFAVGLTWVLIPFSVASFSVECTGSAVTVTAPERTEAEWACEAVQEAISFLEANGLHVDAPFNVHLVSEVPADRRQEEIFGCYSHQDRSVHVLTMSRCRGVKSPFGLEMNRILHQGVIGHEVAHAVAAQNFGMSQPSLLAQEYIAHVTQLAILPPDVREKILVRFPGGGLRPAAASNLMLLAMDPGRFAALAYRHYSQPGNGVAFFQRVLSGNVLRTDIDVR
jgi:hypothetical protein